MTSSHSSYVLAVQPLRCTLLIRDGTAEVFIHLSGGAASLFAELSNTWEAFDASEADSTWAGRAQKPNGEITSGVGQASFFLEIASSVRAPRLRAPERWRSLCEDSHRPACTPCNGLLSRFGLRIQATVGERPLQAQFRPLLNRDLLRGHLMLRGP